MSRCIVSVQATTYKSRITRCEKKAKKEYCSVHKNMIESGKKLKKWEGDNGR